MIKAIHNRYPAANQDHLINTPHLQLLTPYLNHSTALQQAHSSTDLLSKGPQSPSPPLRLVTPRVYQHLCDFGLESATQLSLLVLQLQHPHFHPSTFSLFLDLKVFSNFALRAAH